MQSMLNTSWTADGVHQGQVDVIMEVPKVTPAAISPPSGRFLDILLEGISNVLHITYR
jgi:hypothetical protein